MFSLNLKQLYLSDFKIQFIWYKCPSKEKHFLTDLSQQSNGLEEREGTLLEVSQLYMLKSSGVGHPTLEDFNMYN